MQQFGDDVEPSLVLADIEYGNNIRMIERTGRAHFLLEAIQPVRAPGELFTDYFNCNFAAQPRISGAVDDTHATFSKPGKDFIGTNVTTDFECHGDRFVRFYHFTNG